MKFKCCFFLLEILTQFFAPIKVRFLPSPPSTSRLEASIYDLAFYLGTRGLGLWAGGYGSGYPLSAFFTRRNPPYTDIGVGMLLNFYDCRTGFPLNFELLAVLNAAAKRCRSLITASAAAAPWSKFPKFQNLTADPQVNHKNLRAISILMP